MLKAADQSRDISGQDTHKILAIHQAPEYVKKASIAARCGHDNMPRTGYADPVRKLYPCHTAPATWLSAAFYYTKAAETGETNPDVEHTLQKVAKSFGILADIDVLQQAVKTATTHAEGDLPDEAFALILEYEDGRRERKYPMRNALEVKTAAEYLHKYRAEFTYQDRHHIANKILEKAADYAAPITEYVAELERMAGRGICASEDAAALLRERAYLIRNRDAEGQKCAAALNQMADTIESLPAQFKHFDKLDKLAAVIDDVDRTYGIVNRYGQGVFDYPENTLFAVTEKLAADMSDDLISTMTGNFYKKSDLEQLARESFEPMGDDFIQAVTIKNTPLVDGEKLAEIVPTLPLPDAERFDLIVAAAGVSPFALGKSAATVSRIDNPDVQAAASKYAQTARPGSLWSRVESNRGTSTF